MSFPVTFLDFKEVAVNTLPELSAYDIFCTFQNISKEYEARQIDQLARELERECFELFK